MYRVKRKVLDENETLEFINQSGEPKKRVRRVSRKVDEATLKELRNQRSLDDAREAEAHKAKEAAAAALVAANADFEERKRATARVSTVLATISTEYPSSSLHQFLKDLLTTKDRAQSSQVSQMLISHARELLDFMHERQPIVMNEWAVTTTADILVTEGEKLANYLRPEQGEKVSVILERFNLQKILGEVETLAPTLCKLLRSVAKKKDSDVMKRKDCDLVSIVKYCKRLS
jgi:hypothetical protein